MADLVRSTLKKYQEHKSGLGAPLNVKVPYVAPGSLTNSTIGCTCLSLSLRRLISKICSSCRTAGYRLIFPDETKSRVFQCQPPAEMKVRWWMLYSRSYSVIQFCSRRSCVMGYRSNSRSINYPHEFHGYWTNFLSHQF